MQSNEQASNGKEIREQIKSMSVDVNGTPQIEKSSALNRSSVKLKDVQVLVSDEQFRTVREELSQSLNLLNSSGNALLSALESMPPSPESGRVMGEYAAQGMRQISKSLCEIILTKQQVIRSVYQIARDEM